MILIADAGSTNTEWFYNSKTFKTQGINPIQQSETEIEAIVRDVAEIAVSPTNIYFYGAGCTPEKSIIVERIIKNIFPFASIMVASDLLAAAHSLCAKEKGIACILGTGANSCLYDGKKIIANTPALGYILGDEGSGAVLGKLFLNALLKGRLSKDVSQDFYETFNLSIADIIERVYRQPLANRYLASLSVFISKYKERDEVRSIISSNFSSFFDNNIQPYFKKEESTPVHFTGSIAYHYQDLLKEVASQKGYSIGKITKSPMEGLIKFYE